MKEQAIKTPAFSSLGNSKAWKSLLFQVQASNTSLDNSKIGNCMFRRKSIVCYCCAFAPPAPLQACYAEENLCVCVFVCVRWRGGKQGNQTSQHQILSPSLTRFSKKSCRHFYSACHDSNKPVLWGVSGVLHCLRLHGCCLSQPAALNGPITYTSSQEGVPENHL